MRYSVKDLLKHLTYKEFLGYTFEGYCKEALLPWIREATPDDPIEWKRWLGKGADIKLKDNTEIECKYVDSYVYASAVVRHVLPRFSSNATERIVLTNNKKRWTRKARELLELNGIQLKTIDEVTKERLGGTVFSCIRIRVAKEYSSINYHYNQPNNSNYNHVKPHLAVSEGVKNGHLAEESLNVGVKLLNPFSFTLPGLASGEVKLRPPPDDLASRDAGSLRPGFCVSLGWWFQDSRNRWKAEEGNEELKQMPRKSRNIPLEVMNPSIEEDLDSPNPIKQNRGLQRLYQSMTNYLQREPSLREIETFLREYKPSFPRKSRESIRKAITVWKAIENHAVHEAIQSLEKELKDNPYLGSYELARLIQRTVEEAIKRAIQYKLKNSKKPYPMPRCQQMAIDFSEVD